MPATPQRDQTADLAVLRLIHDALRRDLRTLGAVLRALPIGAKEQAQGPVHFYDHLVAQLRQHRALEDDVLLPLAGDRVDRAVLPSHGELDAAIARVDAPMRQVRDMGATTRALFVAFDALVELVDAQLVEEERNLLPRLEAVLTAEDVRTFERAVRKGLGRKGAAVFFPWILDGADEVTLSRVVRVLPVQQRLAYRKFWEKAYQREVALRSA